MEFDTGTRVPWTLLRAPEPVCLGLSWSRAHRPAPALLPSSLAGTVLGRARLLQSSKSLGYYLGSNLIVRLFFLNVSGRFIIILFRNKAKQPQGFVFPHSSLDSYFTFSGHPLLSAVLPTPTSHPGFSFLQQMCDAWQLGKRIPSRCIFPSSVYLKAAGK